MDAREFLKEVSLSAKRSRLIRFWADIDMLRENDCTLEQVREFLARNGVEITVAGLSKAIKRREEKGPKRERRQTPAATPPGDTESNGQDTQVEDGAALSENQRRDKAAEKYINQETTNPLIRRKKEKPK